ncbi:MAG: LapA family protein [Halanaerobiaceae bacterium]|nr:LapA family protein [Halanaerobiaceae bacterium]
MNKKIILLLLFALFIAIFSIQNASPVLIRLLFWDFEIYLVLIVLGAIVFGAILMALVTSLSSFRLNKEIRMEKKEKEELLNEVEELKVLLAKYREETPASAEEEKVNENDSTEDSNTSEQELKEEE